MVRSGLVPGLGEIQGWYWLDVCLMIKGLVGVVGSGLVGLYLEGILPGELFTISRN